MLQPLLIDMIKYEHSLGSKVCLFPMLANVAGMASVGFFVRNPGTHSWTTLTSRSLLMMLSRLSQLLHYCVRPRG